jgi:hypothetical protein
VLAGFFLVVTIFALFCSLRSRRRTIERAELGLAARRQAGWFQPTLVAGAIQASRGGGWRRLLPLLALGILAVSLGMERSGLKREDDSEQNGRRQLARAA